MRILELVKIFKYKFKILVIYKPPDLNKIYILLEIQSLLNSCHERKSTSITGDVNFDLNADDMNISRHRDSMSSHGSEQCIDRCIYKGSSFTGRVKTVDYRSCVCYIHFAPFIPFMVRTS